jgi:hypothetical protein
MSDTPRTEIYVLDRLPEIVPADWARQLEREIAAAKERIRRLEAAGNAMHHEMQFGEWRAGTPRAQANAAMDSWRAEMGGMA